MLLQINQFSNHQWCCSKKDFRHFKGINIITYQPDYPVCLTHSNALVIVKLEISELVGWYMLFLKSHVLQLLSKLWCQMVKLQPLDIGTQTKWRMKTMNVKNKIPVLCAVSAVDLLRIISSKITSHGSCGLKKEPIHPRKLSNICFWVLIIKLPYIDGFHISWMFLATSVCSFPWLKSSISFH